MNARRTMAMRQFFGVSLALFAALFVIAKCTDCTPARTADATYAADMLACVDKSATIEESRACRAKVRDAWHVDGGAR